MYITIPNPPSPAFIPPDKRASGKLKTRDVKEETLRQFLQDLANGKVNKELMWALFLVSDSTPTLGIYFVKLADSLGIKADVTSVEAVIEDELGTVEETKKPVLTNNQTTGLIVPAMLSVICLILVLAILLT